MEEAAGGVRELELIFIKAGAGLCLIPDRGQPPARGSVVATSADSALVYTTGFENETGKWRGKYVPKPYGEWEKLSELVSRSLPKRASVCRTDAHKVLTLGGKGEARRGTGIIRGSPRLRDENGMWIQHAETGPLTSQRPLAGGDRSPGRVPTVRP
jgi:hypothetical protein